MWRSLPYNKANRLQNGSFLQQLTNGIGGLSAVGQPLLGLIGVDADNAGVLGGIVVADLLDETAVTSKTAVSDNNGRKEPSWRPCGADES